mgnify:CR=1 FL=1
MPTSPACSRNRGKGQYGCTHYRRRVKFVTPCCDGEEWWCRHCHNKAKDTDEQVGLRCVKLDGGMTLEQRNRTIDTFTHNPGACAAHTVTWMNV